MIGVDEARSRVLSRVPPLGTERVPLARAARRVLREPAVADRDLPPFHRAAMDGYAVRAADVRTAGAELRIVGRVRAGERSEVACGPGEAIAIMTGAPAPAGGEVVVPVERTRLSGTDRVTIETAATAGANIAPRGSEALAGTEILSAGRRISRADIATLASVGIATPLVSIAPRVAFIVTGDEVVDPAAAPADAQIRNANGPAVCDAIEEAGGFPEDLGIVPDDRRALARAVERGLGCDALVLSGGVSAGEFDFVEEVLSSYGAESHVTSVRVKPGAPFVFATRGATPVFGLPGNPVSAQVTFELFVRPALLRMQGATAILRPVLSATLREAVKNRSGRDHYLPVRAVWSEATNGFVASPVRSQGSGDVSAHARANALAIMEAERFEARAGERVPLYPLERLLEAAIET